MTAEMACRGIVERRLGKEYADWFVFEQKQQETESYTLSMAADRVKIQGSSGVAMAAGLSYYLKKFCHVYIGQQTQQTKMPKQPVLLKEPVCRTAYSRIRYAYNYCTLSYTMPFWDEECWQRELDWLALSGVNLVLDFTGIEEVWYRFLSELGYEEEEIRRWIVGPCYTAWQQMQNIEQIGGPVPRQFFRDRAELAKKNHRFMKAMGMTPIRQGYGGMVPSWHNRHDPSVTVFEQGEWNGLIRPAMLDTASDTYRDYAERFYRIQDEVFGTDSHYYAADVFHEGGIRPESLTDDRIAEIVLRTMLKHDEKAVWVVQAWRENPTPQLLAGIRKAGSEHALILDLSATDQPEWKKNEFGGTPWVYCMLDMYGGRVSTHGEPDVLAREIPAARKNSAYMAGIGFASEATLHNPIVFDLLFDMAWEKEPVSQIDWLKDWLTARYGCFHEKAMQAWEGLLATAYRSPGYSHHGGYTQIFTFRPKPDMAYGEIFNELNSSVIKKPYYDTEAFEKAVFMLGEAADELSGEETWCYDMQDLLRQVLNNRACPIALAARDAKLRGDKKTLQDREEEFFALFDACDRLMCVRSDTTLADWEGYAARAGALYGEETRKLFVEDARRLITTWAGEKTYETLADYAYRQYGGLLKRYYRPRWERFFRSEKPVSVQEWYELAQQFIHSQETAAEEILPAAEQIRSVRNLLWPDAGMSKKAEEQNEKGI